MAYTLTIPIDADQTGLTFTAQLTDENGDPVGGTITGGTYEAVGDDYEWTYDAFPDTFTAGHVVFTDNNNDTYSSQIYELDAEESDPTQGEWYYADQEDVEDKIGVTSLAKISNEPDASSDATTDTSRLVRVGILVDQEMDARLSAMGYVTPLAHMSAGTVKIMSDISAGLVAWKLNEPRMLLSLSSSRQASAIDLIIGEHRKAAEMMLQRIALRIVNITADRLYTRPPYGKVLVATWSSNTNCGALCAL
jgi:hypothetical protein